MGEIAALGEGADQVGHDASPSFRKPTPDLIRGRLSGIHNPETFSFARTRITACLVVMDSGLTAEPVIGPANRPDPLAAPRNDSSLQPVAALERRVTHHRAL